MFVKTAAELGKSNFATVVKKVYLMAQSYFVQLSGAAAGVYDSAQQI